MIVYLVLPVFGQGRWLGFHKLTKTKSLTKTEYKKCKFSKSKNRDEGEVRFDGQETLKRENFLYLGSIIHKDGEIEEDVNHRIKGRWMKWRSASEVLCDRRIPIKLKGKILQDYHVG